MLAAAPETAFFADAIGCFFVVYGDAKPGGSKRIVPIKGREGMRRVIDSNKNVMPWRQEVAQVASGLMGTRAPFSGPLKIWVDFYQSRLRSHYGKKGLRPSAPHYPVKRPDATKLLRPVEDALTGILWYDDSQIVEQHVRKLYAEPGNEASRMVFSLKLMQ